MKKNVMQNLVDVVDGVSDITLNASVVVAAASRVLDFCVPSMKGCAKAVNNGVVTSLICAGAGKLFARVGQKFVDQDDVEKKIADIKQDVENDIAEFETIWEERHNDTDSERVDTVEEKCDESISDGGEENTSEQNIDEHVENDNEQTEEESK